MLKSLVFRVMHRATPMSYVLWSMIVIAIANKNILDKACFGHEIFIIIVDSSGYSDILYRKKCFDFDFWFFIIISLFAPLWSQFFRIVTTVSIGYSMPL